MTIQSRKAVVAAARRFFHCPTSSSSSLSFALTARQLHQGGKTARAAWTLQTSTTRKKTLRNGWCSATSAASFSSSPSSLQPDRRLSVAIVGAGPAGFYTAKYLHSYFERHESAAAVDIDLLERLPTPFGLVRFGVAPDHPEVKNVQHDFEQVMNASDRKKDNRHPNSDSASSVQYFGNLQVGRGDEAGEVTLGELRRMYHAVVLCYGCASDRKLGIPGESPSSSSQPLQGVLSAREFVAWYNGHPDFGHIGQQVEAALCSKQEQRPNAAAPQDRNVVVIGQGNVALDCARILAKGANGLQETDLASHALPLLQSGVRHTTVVGRRGHLQGAFTIKELRELTKLKEEGHATQFVVLQTELDQGMTPATVQEMESTRGKARIHKLLCDASATILQKDHSCPKTVALRFLLRPAEILPSPQHPDKVGAVVFEKTRLEGEAGRQRAVGTGEFETIPSDMVLISIGYKGVALPGMEEEGLFDETSGTMRNVQGRVIARGASASDAKNSIVGLYASGWLKRGPQGIIGTNIADAKETVACLVQDFQNGTLDPQKDSPPKSGRRGLVELLQERNIDYVDWERYQLIDAVERDPSRLRSAEQPREKLVEVEEMLRVSSGR